jgi:hypothetical protein
MERGMEGERDGAMEGRRERERETDKQRYTERSIFLCSNETEDFT